MTWKRVTSLCGLAAAAHALKVPIQDVDARWKADGVKVVESSQASVATALVQNSSNSVTAQGGARPVPSPVAAVPTPVPRVSQISLSDRPQAATRLAASALANAIPAAPEISAIPASIEALGVNMVTNVMTWIATDEYGDFVSKTSTYINDRADIDWEPSTVTYALAEPSPFPTSATQAKTNPSGQGMQAGDIPSWTITGKETVARTMAASEGTAVPSEAGWESGSYDFEHLPFIGSPFAWLASERGGDPAVDTSGHVRGEQIGRLEGTRQGPKINATLAKNYYGSLPSAIAELLKAHSEFNMALLDGKLPFAVELELLLQLGNGQPPIPATYVSSSIPSLILPSATIAMGGPAATVQGQRVSLGTQGVVAGTKTISLQAVAPILPTDFAAIFTMEESAAPVTLVKDAGNPNFIFNNDLTLTAGSPATTTAGHTVEYNTRGQIIIDNIQTIDPSPVRKAEVAAATNRAAGGGPSGSNMSNTKSNGRVVGGILIDGSAGGKGAALPAAANIPDPNTDPGMYPISQSDRKDGTNISPQAQAQKAGTGDPSSSTTTTMTTTRKPGATAAGASQPSTSAKAGAGVKSFEVRSTSFLALSSFFTTFVAILFAL